MSEDQLPGHGYGADSEVGRLRTVLLHRPGPELTRLTPRNNDRLLFDGIPWVARAQDEHDAFAAALRERDVEVLYLTDLLTETLESGEARELAIDTALSGLHLGDTLKTWLGPMLRESTPAELTTYLTAGIRNDEVRGGHGLVTSLLDPHDFLIDPLPNLLFTRDSSVWMRDRVSVTSLAMPARKRETQLTELIWSGHLRFAGVERIHGWRAEHVEGGDVLLLAPGVVAIGVGERTTPAGAEQLAREVFGAGLAHTVLAVPIAQERATMHLDTVCTMVDVDKVVMYPNMADSLMAYAVTVADRDGDGDGDALSLTVAPAEHFLIAAAKAMSIDTLHQIDTGLDPVTAEREQW
ncbi:MAG: arginine deiminase family protein, partial [Nocardioides sp.]